jgi:trimethylamine:corrinoid methyltransferase-like protein
MLALVGEARLEAVHDALRRTLVDLGVPVADAVVFVATAGAGARVAPV